MNVTAEELAKLIKGEVIGDTEVRVNSVGEIQNGKYGDVCFIANKKYESYIYESSASIIIISNKFLPKKKINTTLIKVEDPYLAFSKVMDLNNVKHSQKGISENSDISENAKINKDVFIGSFTKIAENVLIEENVKIHSNCFIGRNVSIGKNTIIFPGVNIYHDCKIGKNNIIHSGAIIGADGFGFVQEDSNYKKIHQLGNVLTEEKVEIGANTAIDRGTIGSTKIRKGVKLDNLIQIGHNVEIGKNTVIAGLTAIAGSTRIGENCMIGGHVAISGHLKIGSNVRIAGHSGVGSNIKDNQTIQGPFAFDIKKFQKSYVLFKRLPEIYNMIRKLTKKS